jgi:hypothetical protein
MCPYARLGLIPLDKHRLVIDDMLNFEIGGVNTWILWP